LVSAAFVVVPAGLNKTKVNWKPSKALGSAGSWTVGSMQRGEKLGDWAEFVFGGQHCGGCLEGSIVVDVWRAGLWWMFGGQDCGGCLEGRIVVDVWRAGL